MGKSVDIVRHFEGLGDPAGGIMIAFKIKDANIIFPEHGHLAGKKKSGVIVIPIPVKKISRNHHKGNSFFDRRLNESFEGLPCSASDGINRGTLVVGQPPKGAIEMDICSMNELEHILLLRRTTFGRGSFII